MLANSLRPEGERSAIILSYWLLSSDKSCHRTCHPQDILRRIWEGGTVTLNPTRLFESLQDYTQPGTQDPKECATRRKKKKVFHRAAPPWCHYPTNAPLRASYLSRQFQSFLPLQRMIIAIMRLTPPFLPSGRPITDELKRPVKNSYRFLILRLAACNTRRNVWQEFIVS